MEINTEGDILVQVNEYDIIHYQDESLLRFIWNQHPPSAVFRKGYHQFLQEASTIECRNWLFDSREIYFLEIADQNWMAALSPYLIQLQIKKIAIVLTQEAMDLLFTENIIAQADKNFGILKHTAIEIFSDIDIAFRWLRKA